MRLTDVYVDNCDQTSLKFSLWKSDDSISFLQHNINHNVSVHQIVLKYLIF